MSYRNRCGGLFFASRSDSSATTPGAYLDSSGAESAIRPLKLGAKNWLFIGHPDAGTQLANFFTLVESCRQAGIDMEGYLIDFVTHLPAHSILRLDDLLPRSWRRARALAIRCLLRELAFRLQTPTRPG